MKFSIEKQTLLSNIQHLYQIVPTKNTMPILTNYLVEADESANKIKFTASDLEITVIVEFEANISEGGKVAVSARNLNDLINLLPDSMVHFVLEEDKLKILCGNTKYDLNCAETSQFPLIPQKNLENVIKLDAGMFKKMIDNTHFAVSTEVNRPIFTGIFWKMTADEQLMVATDGKKIAEFKLNNQIEVPENVEQIIPTKGLLFLNKVFSEEVPEVSVLIESSRVMFIYGNYTIFTHIIEGKFPDYAKAIPANNNNVLKIKKNIMKDAVKRVALLASEDTFKVKLDISISSFSLSAVKREEGEANENLEEFNYTGEPLVIAFNYRYLNSILNVLESDFIEIRMGKSNEPALFFNSETDAKYTARFLLMPLRLA
ncbi:MAG TPA: DNA polymerase III subunit beta [Candidatus Cloacimonadota bacterium]|nr:DNA polymerase III subunit beta [Candidatus Cloacimonadota bacterium]